MEHSLIPSKETKQLKTGQKHMKQDFQHIDKQQQKQGKQQENKQVNGTNISKWHISKTKGLKIVYKDLDLIVSQMVHL